MKLDAPMCVNPASLLTRISFVSAKPVMEEKKKADKLLSYSADTTPNFIQTCEFFELRQIFCTLAGTPNEMRKSSAVVETKIAKTLEAPCDVSYLIVLLYVRICSAILSDHSVVFARISIQRTTEQRILPRTNARHTECNQIFQIHLRGRIPTV